LFKSFIVKLLVFVGELLLFCFMFLVNIYVFVVIFVWRFQSPGFSVGDSSKIHYHWILAQLWCSFLLLHWEYVAQ
jgi:hypothetical protein